MSRANEAWLSKGQITKIACQPVLAPTCGITVMRNVYKIKENINRFLNHSTGTNRPIYPYYIYICNQNDEIFLAATFAN